MKRVGLYDVSDEKMKTMVSQNDKFLKRQSYLAIQDYLIKYNFNAKELILIKLHYDNISKSGILTRENWRDSLGIMGMEHSSYLADRTFDIIDKKSTGKAKFEDFLNYLDTLINGNQKDKVRQSFDILDSRKKGFLEYIDIENMIHGVCMLWNYLTGTKVVADKEYLQTIFSNFDIKNKGFISFEDFFGVYSTEPMLMGWFEFLNQDTNGEEIKIKVKLSKNSYSREDSLGIFKNNNETFEELISVLEKELQDCISTLVEDITKPKQILNSASTTPSIEKKEEDNTYLLKNDSESSTRSRSKAIGGPYFSTDPTFNKKGDQGIFYTFQDFDEADEMDSRQDLENSPMDFKISKDTEVAYSGPFYNNNDVSHKGDSFNQIQTVQEDRNHFLYDISTRLHSLQGYLNRLKNKSKGVDSKEEIPALPRRVSGTPRRITGYSADEALRARNISIVDGHSPKHRKSCLNTIPNIKTKKDGVRKNLSIYFGHKNWNLVLNIMIGIRTCLKNIYPDFLDQITDQDFKLKCEYDLIQKRTRALDIRKTCRFYDYAPKIFEKIRLLYDITNENFLKSIGPEQLLASIIMGNLSSLTELCSSGKSGSLFYYSYDGQFVLKTISKDEFFFFKKILEPYFNHLTKFSDSLITKIFGLYKMKIPQNKNTTNKIYIIVMKNNFHNCEDIDVKYDLKGSMYGRTSRSPNIYWDKTIALKDQDFLEDQIKIQLGKKDAEKLKLAIENDCHFFQENKIIDYSLLVGIHFISKAQLMSKKVENNRISLGESSKFYEVREDFTPSLIYLIDVHFQAYKGGILSSDTSKIYYIGIIDILTSYNLKKQVEHKVKRTFLGGGISCVPPTQYSQRFSKFMKENITDA